MGAGLEIHAGIGYRRPAVFTGTGLSLKATRLRDSFIVLLAGVFGRANAS